MHANGLAGRRFPPGQRQEEIVVLSLPSTRFTGITDLESDQRDDQGKADGIRDDNYEIAFQDAVPDPQGESSREYRKCFGRQVVG